MAELSTIARPYAQAIFSLAKEKGELGRWSEMLTFVEDVYAHPQVQAALANPELTKPDIERLLLAICGERLDGDARNLLILLVRNDRLDVIPALVERYEQLREEAENVVEAHVESAFDLSGEQLRLLTNRLEKKTGRRVKPEVVVVPALIGGVRVQIGDEVWDGSVRGQLHELEAALTR
jgi:F-type H+-transporting ATPase subunit delta